MLPALAFGLLATALPTRPYAVHLELGLGAPNGELGVSVSSAPGQ
jgi:hypothetical protein